MTKINRVRCIDGSCRQPVAYRVRRNWQSGGRLLPDTFACVQHRAGARVDGGPPAVETVTLFYTVTPCGPDGGRA
jgi:hypothetical protein